MRAIFVSAALLLPLAALANDDTYNMEKKAEVKDSKDTKASIPTDLTQSQLLDKLHKVSLGHYEMGNLAQTRAKDDRIKKLGTNMSKDFGKLDQDVIGYAKEHDIILGDALAMGKKVTAKDGKASKYDRLSKLQGAEFDTQYLTATVEGCEKFIPVLEGAKGKFDDRKFDGVLDKAIDTLKWYQTEAQKLQGIEKPAI